MLEAAEDYSSNSIVVYVFSFEAALSCDSLPFQVLVL